MKTDQRTLQIKKYINLSLSLAFFLAYWLWIQIHNTSKLFTKTGTDFRGGGHEREISNAGGKNWILPK
jgi:hypothetical protein